MELPNLYFQDFPIEFKTLEIKDFSKSFKVEKTTIDLDGINYLNDVLQEHIRIQKKNTVVINTPVVQKIADEEFGGNLQEYYQSIIDALS